MANKIFFHFYTTQIFKMASYLYNQKIMSSLIKIKNKYQSFIQRNYISIQLYFSVAFITFLYLALDGSQDSIFIAFIKGLFWPFAAFFAFLF
jgi:hypothetical protein